MLKIATITVTEAQQEKLKAELAKLPHVDMGNGVIHHEIDIHFEVEDEVVTFSIDEVEAKARLTKDIGALLG